MTQAESTEFDTVEIEVLNCLGYELASAGLGARVDTASMPKGNFQKLAAAFERRSQIVVQRTYGEIGRTNVVKPRVAPM